LNSEVSSHQRMAVVSSVKQFVSVCL